MSRICEACSKDPFLKKIIREEGIKGKCSLCGSKSRGVIDTSQLIFINTINCLIRYYFSECEYHSKLGGQDFYRLLSEDKRIFAYPKKINDDVIDDFLMSFIEELDKDISLFTAYGRDIYCHWPKSAVSYGASRLLSTISEELKKQNYFLVEPKFRRYFKRTRAHVTHHIKAEEIYIRARIGAIKSASNVDIEKNYTNYFYTPYQAEAIGAPPIL